MTFAPFASVSEVKELLRLPPDITTDDALLQRFIYKVTEEFRNAMNREILSATYTETRNGTGTNTILLGNWPVTAVSSVLVGPPSAGDTLRTPWVLYTDYVWTDRALQATCGRFPRGVANVVITYTAGFAAIPFDLSVGCAKVAALRYRELERLGQLSKALAGETITFDPKTFPSDVADTLANYRRVVPISAVIAQ